MIPSKLAAIRMSARTIAPRNSRSNRRRKSSISRRGAPELCDCHPLKQTRGRRESRMHAAPAVSCARMHEKTHTSIQVQRRQSGFPCAVAYGLFRALLGDRAFLPPSPARYSRGLDASVGASGPHGFAVRFGSRSSCASICVHRIPPRVRDDRDPPLSSGETGGSKSLICPTAKAEYFSQQGWTGFCVICPSGCYVARGARDCACAQGDAGDVRIMSPMASSG